MVITETGYSLRRQRLGESPGGKAEPVNPGISIGGILVIIGVVVALFWSIVLGIIIALVGLIAFGGFARGRWY